MKRLSTRLQSPRTFRERRVGLLGPWSVLAQMESIIIGDIGDDDDDDVNATKSKRGMCGLSFLHFSH